LCEKYSITYGVVFILAALRKTEYNRLVRNWRANESVHSRCEHRAPLFNFSSSSSHQCHQHSTNKTWHLHYQQSFPTQCLNIVLWTPSCRRCCVTKPSNIQQPLLTTDARTSSNNRNPRTWPC
jgi:hypothetical protein